MSDYFDNAGAVAADFEGIFSDASFEVLRAIEASGFEAWFVGGCVRDALMGRPCNDVDIATSAHWQDVARACEARGMKAYETGVKHGTVTIVVEGEDFSTRPDGLARNDVGETLCGSARNDVKGSPTHVISTEVSKANEAEKSIPHAQESFEVTTYRTDSESSADARHPDSVTFVSSIEEDLARRDFTINAMAWHPERGLLDIYGGRDDISRKVIRTVGDPMQRFREDALRILRAARFSSELGFTIESSTYSAMVKRKCLLARVSQERITHELDRLLLGDHAGTTLLNTVDALAFVMPELVPMKNHPQVTKYHCFDILEHTTHAVDAAPRTRICRWAALCHDMGKPAAGFFDDNGTQHFYGHAAVSVKIARGLLSRLLMSQSFIDDVCTIIKWHSEKLGGEGLTANKRAVRRMLARMGGRPELMRSYFGLKRADIVAHAPEYRGQVAMIDNAEIALEEVLAEGEAFTVGQLAIDGKDVIGLDVAEGPEVGRLLSAALEAVINDEVPNEHAALTDFIKQIRES